MELNRIRIAVIADPAPFRLIRGYILQKDVLVVSQNFIGTESLSIVQVNQTDRLRGVRWDYYYEIYDICDVSDEMLRCVEWLKEKGVPLLDEKQLKDLLNQIEDEQQ